jgi:hypothetical protein
LSLGHYSKTELSAQLNKRTFKISANAWTRLNPLWAATGSPLLEVATTSLGAVRLLACPATTGGRQERPGPGLQGRPAAEHRPGITFNLGRRRRRAEHRPAANVDPGLQDRPAPEPPTPWLGPFPFETEVETSCSPGCGRWCRCLYPTAGLGCPCGPWCR